MAEESLAGPALWRDCAGGLAGDGEGYHGSDSFEASLMLGENDGELWLMMVIAIYGIFMWLKHFWKQCHKPA